MFIQTLISMSRYISTESVIMTVSDTHRIQTSDLDTPPRLLLGPGPSNAHPRVLRALSNRQVGHLDPTFIELMNEVQELLRYAWQTDNRVTIPVSGTGSAAMEAAVANSVEAGDSVLVGCNGYFGERMVVTCTAWKNPGENLSASRTFVLRWKLADPPFWGWCMQKHPQAPGNPWRV